MPTAPSDSGSDAPQLSTAQLKNAKGIINAGQSMGMSSRDIAIGLATALTESSLQIYANPNIPASLNYAHDTVSDGSNLDSLGLFQQRNSWGTVAQRMNAEDSAKLFFDRLKGIKNRNMIEPGMAAQDVQISAYPDRYQENWTKAELIYAGITGGTISAGKTSGTTTTADAKTSGLGSLWAILGDLNDAQWWRRVGVFALGGAFVLVAGVWVIHDSGVVGKAVGAGTKVAATGAKAAAIIAA